MPIDGWLYCWRISSRSCSSTLADELGRRRLVGARRADAVDEGHFGPDDQAHLVGPLQRVLRVRVVRQAKRVGADLLHERQRLVGVAARRSPSPCPGSPGASPRRAAGAGWPLSEKPRSGSKAIWRMPNRCETRSTTAPRSSTSTAACTGTGRARPARGAGSRRSAPGRLLPWPWRRASTVARLAGGTPGASTSSAVRTAYVPGASSVVGQLHADVDRRGRGDAGRAGVDTGPAEVVERHVHVRPSSRRGAPSGRARRTC